MKKFWDGLSAAVRHNIFLTVAAVIVLAMVFYAGCDSTTRSLTSPEVKVTRAQLNIEYQTEVAKLENALTSLNSTFQLAGADLDKKDQMKEKLTQAGATFLADPTSFSYTGLVTLAMSILGVGAVADNRVKDVKIKTMQNTTTA